MALINDDGEEAGFAIDSTSSKTAYKACKLLGNDWEKIATTLLFPP